MVSIGCCAVEIKRCRAVAAAFTCHKFSKVISQQVENTEGDKRCCGNNSAYIFWNNGTHHLRKSYGYAQEQRTDRADYNSGAKRNFYSRAAYSHGGSEAIGADCSHKQKNFYHNYRNTAFFCN